MSRRTVPSLAAAAFLLLALPGCDDPTAVRGPIYPFNALTTTLRVTPATITAGEDTATVRLTFANATGTSVGLSRNDRCPRFAIGVQRSQAVFTLTKFCDVAGVTPDSIEQTYSVPAGDSLVVEVPFTGRARIATSGGDELCALSGRLDLLVLVQDDAGRIGALPVADGESTVSAPLTVNEGGLPRC